MTTLTLPNINCPLPYRIYPESEKKLEEGTISWMDKWHLYSDKKTSATSVPHWMWPPRGVDVPLCSEC